MPWLSWERHELRFNCRSSPWLEPAVVQLSSTPSLFCLCSDSSQQRWECWFPALGKLCCPLAFTEFGSWFLLELRYIQAFTGWGISYFLLPGAETTVQKSHTLGAGCVHFPFPVPPVSFPGSREGTFPGAEPPVPVEGFLCQRDRGVGDPSAALEPPAARISPLDSISSHRSGQWIICKSILRFLALPLLPLSPVSLVQ